MLKCPIRKQLVVDRPEERVRCEFLQRLIEELGFPQSLIAVEVSLQGLPHLSHTGISFPKRRADILCFQKKEDLTPLLLIECKSIPLRESMLKQLFGYNAYVQAPFVALVNGMEQRLAWHSTTAQGYQSHERVLPFQILVQALKSSGGKS